MSTTHPTPKRNNHKTHISKNPLRSRLWAPSGPGFKRGKDDWATPRAVFDRLNREFSFNLDAAATDRNALCSRYYTEADDSLQQRWEGTVWLNPPYGRQIINWLRKAYTESRQGATIVCLVPARPDTAWWHDYVMKAAEIRLIRGRLKFGGASSGAPFPSAIVVFQPPDRCPAQPVFKAVER